jgi:hypothetical protein
MSEMASGKASRVVGRKAGTAMHLRRRRAVSVGSRLVMSAALRVHASRVANCVRCPPPTHLALTRAVHLAKNPKALRHVTSKACPLGVSNVKPPVNRNPANLARNRAHRASRGRRA